MGERETWFTGRGLLYGFFLVAVCAKKSACVCVCVCVCVCARARHEVLWGGTESAHVCVRACVCVCMGAREREREI